MKKLVLSIGAASALYLSSAPANAASCYDLWYQRNEIFAANGYCFKSQLGIDTFGNADCYTSKPRLSASDRRTVAGIKAEERRKGCRVNN